MFWYPKKRSPVSVVSLNEFYTDAISAVCETLTGKLNQSNRKKLSACLFVLDFDGDIMASQAEALTHEITTILLSFKQGDKVLVRLTSPGGAAHAYGYAATQLSRLKDAKIPLIVAVDKVAASGGYMMACVADHIIAAPFAIVGSIGVVAEFPNFFDLLKSLGIDYKQYTAGKYKRTVSPLGPITPEGEEKFQEDLMSTYNLFKDHVLVYRPKVDIEKVATGEHWQAISAVNIGLVDQIKTAEEYIVESMSSHEVLKLAYVGNQKTFIEKVSENLMFNFVNALSKAFMKIIAEFNWQK